MSIMTVFSNLRLAGTVAGTIFAAVPAFASYDGGTVNFQYYAYGGTYNGSNSPSTFAAPGNAVFGNYFTVAVSGSKITYTFDSDTIWSTSAASLNSGGLYIDNGSLISNVSGLGPITSVSLDPTSMLGSSGFGAANITFNTGAVAVSWGGFTFAQGNTVVLDVNVTGGTVPEPATWALMIGGLAMTGFAVRRRRIHVGA